MPMVTTEYVSKISRPVSWRHALIRTYDVMWSLTRPSILSFII